MSSISNSKTDPYLEIVVEPSKRGQRFRYECEGRYAGTIQGDNDKSFPTVRLCNMAPAKEAIIVASCVTKDQPYRAHPHSLVGRQCNKGVCTVKLKDGNDTYEFKNLGIRCVKRNAIGGKLEERKKIRVDPFANGFEHSDNLNSIDTHCLRICFQAFLPDGNKQFRRVVKPIVTRQICDQKKSGELKIVRVSSVRSSFKGGSEVVILCDKINKDDIEVVFIDEKNEWEATARILLIHHQFAIVVLTPPVPDFIESNSEAFKVKMRLHRPSDDEESNDIDFNYVPYDYGDIESKRRRKTPIFSNQSEDLLNHLDLQSMEEVHTYENGQNVDVMVSSTADDQDYSDLIRFNTTSSTSNL